MLEELFWEPGSYRYEVYRHSVNTKMIQKYNFSIRFSLKIDENEFICGENSFYLFAFYFYIDTKLSRSLTVELRVEPVIRRRFPFYHELFIVMSTRALVEVIRMYIWNTFWKINICSRDLKRKEEENGISW